ncbi:hypothetical protein DFP72DRAFT_1067496 [Ephemerocybe angulata]|uniref:Uncharacterized protein n=1 Tax=Ephemerocybe angulata TaxID=980116 RepID=A0A8H6I0H0_9AGAR|nr:hypothetical protein DFP72DRAFT_1067496 [Tulosesus angulatus]
MHGTTAAVDMSTLTKAEGLWFEDGNLILVFGDMFAFPPPAEGNTMFDGCPIVQTYDSAKDMGFFLRAVLDSESFPLRRDDPSYLSILALLRTPSLTTSRTTTRITISHPYDQSYRRSYHQFTPAPTLAPTLATITPYPRPYHPLPSLPPPLLPTSTLAPTVPPTTFYPRSYRPPTLAPNPSYPRSYPRSYHLSLSPPILVPTTSYLAPTTSYLRSYPFPPSIPPSLLPPPSLAPPPSLLILIPPPTLVPTTSHPRS